MYVLIAIIETVGSRMFFEEEEETTPFNLRELFCKGLKERLEYNKWKQWNNRQAGEP